MTTWLRLAPTLLLAACVPVPDAPAEPPAPAVPVPTASARPLNEPVDTAPADTPDATEVIRGPVWDPPYSALVDKVNGRCKVKDEPMTTQAVHEAMGLWSDCVASELIGAWKRAMGASPHARKTALTSAWMLGAARGYCGLGNQAHWDDFAAGHHHDGMDRYVEFLDPCLGSSLGGLIFFADRIGARDAAGFARHVALAQPLGERSRHAAHGIAAYARNAFDWGLPAGYLRWRVGMGGEGVLGAGAWASLLAQTVEAEASAKTFGARVCAAWPELAAEVGEGCEEALDTFFMSTVYVKPVDRRSPYEVESDPLGPSTGGAGWFGYLSPAVRAGFPWSSRAGELITKKTLEPTLAHLGIAVLRAFYAREAVEGPELRQSQIRWADHVRRLCSLDEEQFWTDNGMRYHGHAEGVVLTMCKARAYYLRLVELGEASVSLPDAVKAMSDDARWIGLNLRPGPPAPEDAALGRALAEGEREKLEAESKALTENAKALAVTECARRARLSLAAIDDCEAALDRFYRSYGAFGAIEVLR